MRPPVQNQISISMSGEGEEPSILELVALRDKLQHELARKEARTILLQQEKAYLTAQARARYEARRDFQDKLEARRQAKAEKERQDRDSKKGNPGVSFDSRFSPRFCRALGTCRPHSFYCCCCCCCTMPPSQTDRSSHA